MRYRFESASQMFTPGENDIAILPVKEWQPGCWAEIPALVYPKEEDRLVTELEKLKSEGLTDVVCENIGAVFMAKQLGFTAHGGMFLNVLNSESINEYAKLGLADVTISMELAFSEARKLKASIPFGAVIYGYLPLMKFRACPGDCKSCKGQSVLTDRLGEKFTLICRNNYSELLNCVPLYVADRTMPDFDFRCAYFTKETAEEALKIRSIISEKNEFPGRKTAGLYFRELL